VLEHSVDIAFALVSLVDIDQQGLVADLGLASVDPHFAAVD
jgi:hypothetical protein